MRPLMGAYKRQTARLSVILFLDEDTILAQAALN